MDEWFMWAGGIRAGISAFSRAHGRQVYATNLQQVYSQSFWDLADSTYPAVFSVFIPSGYTMDSVAFTFKTEKYRAFAKSGTAEN